MPEKIRIIIIRMMVSSRQRQKSRWNRTKCPKTFVVTMMTFIRNMEFLPMAMMKIKKSTVMGTRTMVTAVVEGMTERITTMVEKR